MKKLSFLILVAFVDFYLFIPIANADTKLKVVTTFSILGDFVKEVGGMREILLVVPDLTVERAMQLIPGWENLLGPEDFARFPDDLRTAGLP